MKKSEKISDFRPQQRNANKHTPRGLGALDQSIASHGWIGAITVAADNETFDGSARLETIYTRFGDVEPIVVETDGSRPVVLRRTDIPDASDPRAKKLAIAANRIAQLDLDWDPEVLAELNEEIDLSGLFSDDELTGLLEDINANITPQISEEEDEQNTADLIGQADRGEIESRVKLGEIWQLGRHKIACGDSTIESNVRSLLGDRFGSVGMVWSDAPYGISIVSTKRLGTVGGSKPFGSKNVRGTVGASNIVEANKYAPIIGDDTIETAIKAYQLAAQIAPKAIHIWWGANYFSSVLPNTSCWIVWDKENTGNFADAELAWCNHPSAVRIFKHMWNGMIKASEHGERRVHPTQKPIALCDWAFEKYGEPSDLIFDPFLGSAPSIIAAQKMEGDRTVYGFELSPEYCEIIIQRFEKFTGQTAELIGRL